ncbi:MAG TPA: glycoside hydrolase family 15 protein [Casimicrobiaceae bacterium]|jgi:GH15 family glucan-1,4-alpha-glucosidase|nr:glycoside hydrolase family 15 protein [Casimicrobiaceae bacterium]
MNAGEERNLALGVIGNCAFNALIDGRGRIVWCCLPRPDGDPVFSALLADSGATRGSFAVELEGLAEARQTYVANTAILQTELVDVQGNAVRITDFAPRFYDRGRMFRPLLLVRRIVPIAGRPQIRIVLSPTFAYGATEPVLTRGSNHVRYVHATQALRLTSDTPLTYVLDATSHLLDRPANLLFGVDETLGSGIGETARDFEERTAHYWQHWVRALAVPLEWQDAVIRAAITLKLCTYEETGAILAAMTSSIPEAPGTERTWDYRYCWLRDAFFVIRALNGISEVATMESYLRYLFNVVHTATAQGHLQPVYGIGLDADLGERSVAALPGYRGIGPVRIGNQAYEHRQHDVYGHAVLASTQAFFDRRLLRPAGHDDFARLEWLGEQAFALFDQPDAGIWELRTRSDVHTSSAIMCWAACDRLAKIAAHLGLTQRASTWSARGDALRAAILERAWSEKRRAFVATFGGNALDASVLLMSEVNLVSPDDPRWRQTLNAIRDELKHGDHLFRYRSADDFGIPKMAFTACTFWYVDALVRAGATEEARDLFEGLIESRNPLGLLSEHIDPVTRELWGNFPQTYSMVGIINGATRLTRRWETVL